MLVAMMVDQSVALWDWDQLPTQPLMQSKQKAQISIA